MFSFRKPNVLYLISELKPKPFYACKKKIVIKMIKNTPFSVIIKVKISCFTAKTTTTCVKIDYIRIN